MEKYVLHRKDKIIYTTIDVIDKYGIQNVSTKEIAKRQRISEATIFKHFKTKQELLMAVLDFYSQYDDDIRFSVMEKLANPLAAIRFYIQAYTEYYENYPAITAINQATDIITCDAELGERIKIIYTNRINALIEIIEAAKEIGQLPQDIDADRLADIIWGTYQGIILKWRLSEYSFPLTEYTFSTIDLLLDVFKNKQ